MGRESEFVPVLKIEKSVFDKFRDHCKANGLQMKYEVSRMLDKYLDDVNKEGGFYKSVVKKQ